MYDSTTDDRIWALGAMFMDLLAWNKCVTPSPSVPKNSNRIRWEFAGRRGTRRASYECVLLREDDDMQHALSAHL